jgi:hypothetical protein
MTSFKLFGAALILSTAFATPVFAQSGGTGGLPELPGDYAFFLPYDDIAPSAFQPPRVAAAPVSAAPVSAAQVRRPVRPQRISGAR